MKRIAPLALAFVLASCSRGSDSMVNACLKDYRENNPGLKISSFREAIPPVELPKGRSLIAAATVASEDVSGPSYREVLCVERGRVVVAVQQ